MGPIPHLELFWVGPLEKNTLYHKEEGVLKSTSFAVISDRLVHDTLSVHAFKALLIDEIRRRGIPVTHIHYVSDGSAAQYRGHEKNPAANSEL